MHPSWPFSALTELPSWLFSAGFWGWGGVGWGGSGDWVVEGVEGGVVAVTSEEAALINELSLAAASHHSHLFPPFGVFGKSHHIMNISVPRYCRKLVFIHYVTEGGCIVNAMWGTVGLLSNSHPEGRE